MPVAYKDLSKAANDLFNKNYEHGKYSLEFKSKADCGQEFTTKGAQNNVSGDLSSSFEHKIKLCKFGTLKSTCKPGSDKMSFDLENGKLVPNAKLNFLFNLGVSGCPVPNVEALKVNYQPCPDFNMDLESNFGNNLKLAATANVPRIPFLLGFSGALDLGKFALTKQEFAMNYNQGNTNLTCSTALAGDMKCLIFNKINPSLSLATMINHTAAGTNLAIAGASAGACGSSNQFKVDNQGRMALSHITPTNIYGAKLTVSAEFNAFNLDAGDHKLGWGMKFDL